MSNYAICLELQLPGGTVYYSDTALHESARFWEPRLLEGWEPSRSLDAEHCEVTVEALQVALDNADGALSTILEEDTVNGATAKLYLKTLNHWGSTLSTEQRYEGKCRLLSGGQDRVEIEIQPALITELDYLQRKITTDAFPNAPDGGTAGKPSTLGQGMPLVFGNATSTKGKVRLIMIDETANAEKFLVAMGGIYNVTAVYRRRIDSATGKELFTALTGGGTHYTLTRFAVDALGNAYSYITLASGVWQEGDEYYASVQGIPQEGYVTLDGANGRCKVTAANSPTLPGRTGVTGAFTVEAKVRFDALGSMQGICGTFDAPQVDTGFWLYYFYTTNKFRFVVSGNGSSLYRAEAQTTTPAINTDYIIRARWDPENGIAVWINGVAQTLTLSGSNPSALNASALDFEIGSGDSGNYKLDGRVYYCLIASGAQDMASGTSRDRGEPGSPLKDVISEWQFFYPYNSGGTYYVMDLVGDNDLTCVSLTGTDFTLVSYERNPAWMIDRALRWKWYNWRIGSTDIDRSSLGALAAIHATNGWNDSGGQFYSGVLPPDPGAVMETPAALQAMCYSCACAPTIGTDGRLRFVDVNLIDADTGTVDEYKEDLGDFVSIELDWPLRLWNKGVVNYRRIHRDGGSYEASLRANNQLSIDTFDVAEEDTDLPLVGHADMAADIITRHMLHRSGRVYGVDLRMCGIDALQTDVGDKPAITCRNLVGDVDDQQILITDMSDGLWSASPRLRGLAVGQTVGAIAVSREETITITPEIDTFVFEDAPNTQYGTRDFIQIGRDADSKILFGCLRFDLSEIAAAGGTIVEATLRTRTILASKRTVMHELRQLNSTTWSESSTWNNFDSGGVWNTSKWGDTAFSDAINVYAQTYHSFMLNPAGITYLNGRVGADNKAQLTFKANPGPSQWASIASRENGTTAWRPQLTIIYTA